MYRRHSQVVHDVRGGAALAAGAYARSGQRAKSFAILRNLGDVQDDVEKQDIAFAYLALGDRSAALAEFRTVRFGPNVSRAWLARDPRLDPVRNDPAFAKWTVL